MGEFLAALRKTKGYTQQEIAERLKNFKPLEKPVDGYLKRYRAQVTSASKGAVLGSQK